MPLFAFFYECPVKDVNVFSLKRLLFWFIFYGVSYFTFLPFADGVELINTSEIY